MASLPKKCPMAAAAAIPTMISMSAMEIFSLAARNVAMRARPNQSAAIENACSIGQLPCAAAHTTVTPGLTSRSSFDAS
jgi:hypothetical protein